MLDTMFVLRVVLRSGNIGNGSERSFWFGKRERESIAVRSSPVQILNFRSPNLELLTRWPTHRMCALAAVPKSLVRLNYRPYYAGNDLAPARERIEKY